MGKTFDFIELSDSELKEINGGVLPMLIIRLFGPNIEGLVSFWNGVKDGYDRTTQP
jgi:lactobin A/cerein 7B family class IIb bacteriocin